ncbi:Cyanase [Dirofilaria immitis]|nr:Cyanase [Dirofilaria immitis]
MRRSIANVLEGSGITWKSVAEKIGKSKEWTTAACLGQMTMSKKQAEKVAEIFDLPESALSWLQTVPQKVISVYGPTIKELIVEEFGDGIMSAIDFNLTVAREK